MFVEEEHRKQQNKIQILSPSPHQSKSHLSSARPSLGRTDSPVTRLSLVPTCYIQIIRTPRPESRGAQCPPSWDLLILPRFPTPWSRADPALALTQKRPLACSPTCLSSASVLSCAHSLFFDPYSYSSTRQCTYTHTYRRMERWK